MKTNRSLLLIVGAIIASLLMYSCNNLLPDPTTDSAMLKAPSKVIGPTTPRVVTLYDTPVVQDLLAGQFNKVGIVTVGNDADSLYVIYTIESPGWLITETHLFVGDDSALPMNKTMNPQVGLFPYAACYRDGVPVVMFSIPLNTLPECYTVAAHAVVYNTTTLVKESAWAKGTDIGGKSWAMKFGYCTQDGETEPPSPE